MPDDSSTGVSWQNVSSVAINIYTACSTRTTLLMTTWLFDCYVAISRPVRFGYFEWRHQWLTFPAWNSFQNVSVLLFCDYNYNLSVMSCIPQLKTRLFGAKLNAEKLSKLELPLEVVHRPKKNSKFQGYSAIMLRVAIYLIRLTDNRAESKLDTVL